MNKELMELGLTKAQATIYTAAAKLGTCTVKNIAKESGFHRTNIYDVLEQLKEKGLVTFFKEGKSIKYAISDPDNLHAYMNEKMEILDSILPDLKKLQKQSGELIDVEVFKGKEGMKAVWRDILKENKPMYGYGVKGQFREQMPDFARWWLLQAKKQNLPYRAVYTEKENLPTYYTKIKFVSKELSSPVAVFIYADKVNINIWEPSLVAITIKSSLVAKMYKQHFYLLWKIAKEK